ncbi:MAG: hypothetical protein JW915_01900, partial [Chitinispirillaceae bacterium]|nr:hypothetical protein [Chitinispirillaceae bacterium]
IIKTVNNKEITILKSDLVFSRQTCSRWEKCLGGCRAASEQTGGSIANEDPVISLLNGYET